MALHNNPASSVNRQRKNKLGEPTNSIRLTGTRDKLSFLQILRKTIENLKSFRWTANRKKDTKTQKNPSITDIAEERTPLGWFEQLPLEYKQSIFEQCFAYMVICKGNIFDDLSIHEHEEEMEREKEFEQKVTEIQANLQRLMPDYHDNIDGLLLHLEEKIEPGTIQEPIDPEYEISDELSELVEEAYQFYLSRQQSIKDQLSNNLGE